MNLILRKAVVADVPQIVQLHVDTWRHSYRGYIADEIIDSQRFMVSIERLENMKRVVEKSLVYIAEQSGKITGNEKRIKIGIDVVEYLFEFTS